MVVPLCGVIVSKIGGGETERLCEYDLFVFVPACMEWYTGYSKYTGRSAKGGVQEYTEAEHTAAPQDTTDPKKQTTKTHLGPGKY